MSNVECPMSVLAGIVGIRVVHLAHEVVNVREDVECPDIGHWTLDIGQITRLVQKCIALVSYPDASEGILCRGESGHR